MFLVVPGVGSTTVDIAFVHVRGLLEATAWYDEISSDQRLSQKIRDAPVYKTVTMF